MSTDSRIVYFFFLLLDEIFAIVDKTGFILILVLLDILCTEDKIHTYSYIPRKLFYYDGYINTEYIHEYRALFKIHTIHG